MSENNFEMQEKLLQHYEQITKQTLENARMELRDRFAMAALSGLLGNSSLDVDSWAPDGVTRDAYIFADSMLKAREQK